MKHGEQFLRLAVKDNHMRWATGQMVGGQTKYSSDIYLI